MLKQNIFEDPKDDVSVIYNKDSSITWYNTGRYSSIELATTV